jgi:hypothetical protein
LTPWEYDALEAAAIKRTPNRIVEASQTTVFDKAGYPTRISGLDEVWKFADAMQEGRTRRNYERLDGLTEWEFELVCQITQRVERLTRDYCGVQITPASSLLRAVLAYRALEALNPRPHHIIEIGPGSGYLGQMLIMSGKDYYSVENCQAFIMWQRLLFGAEAKQIPWWHWMTEPVPPIDLFVANHVINEMHPIALRYAIRVAPDMFLIESFGGTGLRTDQASINKFMADGFHQVEYGGVTVMHRGEPPRFKPSEKLTRGWDDLLNLWGGHVPMTRDEQFRAMVS